MKTFATGLLITLAVAMIARGAFAAEAEKAEPAPIASPAAISGLPEDWNKKIPIPPGATIVQVSERVHAIRRIEFLSSSDFAALVDFYMTGLKKAGFKLGVPLKMPARKTFNISFEEVGTLNSLSIFPSDKDPSKLSVRIVYVPVGAKSTEPTAAPSGAPTGAMMY